MKKNLRQAVLLYLIGSSVAAAWGQASWPPLEGFTPSHSEKERALEKKFMTVPDPTVAESVHKVLTAEPHMAGSGGDRRNALYMLKELRRFGLEAEIEQFPVLLSEPRVIKVDLVEPTRFSGPHAEYVSEDPASRDPRTTVGFNAYSADGEVTANVVYVNYGRLEDYVVLRSQGISVQGKVVLVRYGECYRGVKVRIAEENKASAVIIYSDPQDDGYHGGESYPQGPWRPPSGVERGSVLYDFLYPGIAADHSNMPHVPVMPLSYADAQPILKNIAGPPAPQAWQGGLPFTYHLGPGPAKVHLKVELDHPVRPVWNVVAKIPGRGQPEEIVIVGNHRDAWAYGGVDPNSGTTALLEMARGFGVLLRDGWRPLRSIWLCSWDAEEQDEFGSTYWAEKNEAELSEKAVSYLNLDSAVAGDRFSVSGVPTLKKFLKNVASDIPDPKGGSILDRANERFREELRTQIRSTFKPALYPPVPVEKREIEVGNLGGGSDYVPFLYHLGIPATDFSFESGNGVYHSIFDNHRWMEEFGDPGFHYHVAAARFYGVESLRLAEADVLPFDYEGYGKEIQSDLAGLLIKLTLLSEEDRLAAAGLQQQAAALAQAGAELHKECSLSLLGSQIPDFHSVNRALVRAEKAFLLQPGLPGRPWYKHSAYAPGIYNGYDAVFLPGVQENIAAGHFEEAQRQLETVTAALARATAVLQNARIN